MHTARQPAREGDATTPLEFTSSEQMKQHYRSIRKRMRGDDAQPVAVMPKPTPEPEIVPEPPAVPPPPPVIDDEPVLEAQSATDTPVPTLSRGAIFRAVAAAAKLSLAEMQSHLRARPLVNARFVYYVLARKYSGASLPQIGHTAGYRDHSTVLHGLRMGAERFKELYPIYRDACSTLEVAVPDVSQFLKVRK